jgi:hypothetical protein
MPVFNNNETIAISFEHWKKRFVLSGLGDYNDSKHLQQVKQTKQANAIAILKMRINVERKGWLNYAFSFFFYSRIRMAKYPKKVKGLPIISRNLSIKQIIFECLVMNKNRQLYRVYRVWHNNWFHRAMQRYFYTLFFIFHIFNG